MNDSTDDNNLLELTTEIAVAWLPNRQNNLSADELPKVIQRIYGALAGTSPTKTEEKAEEYTPAVSVRRSLASKDHIISLLDGKPYKTLKRHLAVNGLTPDEYGARYGLKADYPMVAPAYAQHRSALASAMGLGRKAQAAAKKAAPASELSEESSTTEAPASQAATSAPAKPGWRRKAAAETPPGTAGVSEPSLAKKRGRRRKAPEAPPAEEPQS